VRLITMRRLLIMLMVCTGGMLVAQNWQVICVNLKDSTGPVANASVRVNGSYKGGTSDIDGRVMLRLPIAEQYAIAFYHPAYKTRQCLFQSSGGDTLYFQIRMTRKFLGLDTVNVIAFQKPEVIHKSNHYSVIDFEFTESGFLLLTTGGTKNHLLVRLTDVDGHELHVRELPLDANDRVELRADYQGYINLLSPNVVYRLADWNQRIMIEEIPLRDYQKYLEPVKDSVRGELLYSDQVDYYPAFNYNSVRLVDTARQTIRQIIDVDLMRFYHLEYYYLSSRMQLEARRTADAYRIDEYMAAALLSGFVNSKYYDVLYAPLFLIGDTICIFDHYRDKLYRYDIEQKLLDSSAIRYHHPAKWTDWKKKMFKDAVYDHIYALYSRDGHQYIKRIGTSDGKEKGMFKLTHYSAERIRIRDGYVYYVYRPFGSTQEKYFYRELIRI